MNVLVQATKPIITIYRVTDTGGQNVILSYNPNVVENKRFHITGYTFTETIKDFSGKFSINIYEDLSNYETDSTVWSKIRMLDIVKIEEGIKVFYGVIHSKSFKSSVSGGRVSRQLEVSGMGIQNLFSSYNICLDANAQTNSLIANVQKSLRASIINKNNMEQIVQETWKHFEDVSTKINNNKEPYINTMIKSFFGADKDWFNCGNMPNKYDIACNFYDSNTSTFYSILKSLLPSNAYEVFGDMINDKPKITIRERPFDPKDWGKLDIVKINPLRVLGYSFTACDSEVYSAYLAYIEGSLFSSQQLIQKEAKEQTFGGIQFDDSKLQKYGYRLLQTNFRGATLGTAGDEENQSIETVSSLSSRLKGWYQHIDEMLSGSINFVTNTETAITSDNTSKIKAGTRIDYNGLQFYVEETSHSWTYGDSPKTTLRLSRGGVYIGNQFNAEKTLNCDVTKRYSELT